MFSYKKYIVNMPPGNTRFLFTFYKRIAYGGTNFMPIDVSRIYLQVLSENSEMFFCNTSSVKKTHEIMEEHEIQ